MHNKPWIAAWLLLAAMSHGFSYPAESNFEFLTPHDGDGTVFARAFLANNGTEEVETWILDIETVGYELENSIDQMSVLSETTNESGQTVRTYRVKPHPFDSRIGPGKVIRRWINLYPDPPIAGTTASARILNFDFMLLRPSQMATYRVDDAIVTVIKTGDWAHSAVFDFELRGAKDFSIPDWVMDIDLARDISYHWNCEFTSHGVQKTLRHMGVWEPFDVVPPAGKGFVYFGVETASGEFPLLPLVTRVIGTRPTAKGAEIIPVTAPSTFRLRRSKAQIPVRFGDVQSVSVTSTGARQLKPSLLRRSRVSTIVVRKIKFGNSRVTVRVKDRLGRETEHHIAIQRRRTIAPSKKR